MGEAADDELLPFDTLALEPPLVSAGTPVLLSLLARGIGLASHGVGRRRGRPVSPPAATPLSRRCPCRRAGRVSHLKPGDGIQTRTTLTERSSVYFVTERSLLPPLAVAEVETASRTPN